MTETQYIAYYSASLRKVARFTCTKEASLLAQVEHTCRKYGVPPHEGLRMTRDSIVAGLRRG